MIHHRAVKIFFYQISQLYFQVNIPIALLIIAALFMNNVWLMLAICFASVWSIFLFSILKLDPHIQALGLYGFNPSILALLLFVFFESSLILWLYLTIGIALYFIFEYIKLYCFNGRFKDLVLLNMFALLTTWPAFFLAPDYLAFNTQVAACEPRFVASAICMVSQISFNNVQVTGLAIVMFMLYLAPKQAIALIFSSILTVVLSFLLQDTYIFSSLSLVSLGINLGLTGLVLAVFRFSYWQILCGLVIATVLCIICSFIFTVSFLALPYLLASWIMLSLRVAVHYYRRKHLY